MKTKKQLPQIWEVSNLKNYVNSVAGQKSDGSWGPTRPLYLVGLYLCYRLRCAWLAFTGKCDLVKWDE